MRRLSQLSLSLPLHLTLGFTASALMAAPVAAQDLGTYRPGQAYQSVASPGADVCNSHCAGDAQCRAWNYVKVNPQASGVCEFLSAASAPVQSPISISGENTSQAQFARPVSQGRTNTVRVGTSTKPVTAKPRITRTAPNRRVVREAVPQRVAPQATADRRAKQRRQQAARSSNSSPLSLTEQQNQYRRQTGDLQRQAPAQNSGQISGQATRQAVAPNPRAQQRIGRAQPQYQQSQRRQNRQPQFKPFLDGATGPVLQQNPQAYQGQQRSNQPRQIQPRQNQFGQNQPRQNVQRQSQQRVQGAPSRVQNRGQRRRQAGGRPPIGQPIGAVRQQTPQNPQGFQANPQQIRQQSQAPRAPQFGNSRNLPRASASAPVTQQNAQAAFARRQADLAAIASGNSVDPIQKSLYGRLNDDVKVPTALRNLPTDPNAPIATSASRPVAPVQTETLRQAVGNQLAGGPR